MKRIVLRIRPAEVMDDLDLDLVRARVAQLAGWEVEVVDSRLSDAPYLTVVVKRETLDTEAAMQLQRTFSDLPRMRARVWRRSGPEVSLDVADLDALNAAAEKVE